MNYELILSTGINLIRLPEERIMLDVAGHWARLYIFGSPPAR